MKVSPSKDYHDYVFQDGRFIGAFEEMYQNVDDPWHHGNATDIHYDLSLLLLKRYADQPGKVLDVGCGKGAFTARLKGNFPAYRITGVDIAPTAIKKARQEYGHMGIEFITLDVREYQGIADRVGKDFGLVVMSDIMWYVLPEFENMMRYLDRIVVKDGWLLISQSFCQPEEQKYGSDTVSSPQEMMRLIPYRVVEMIEANRFSNHHAVMLYQV
jgi:SAM-dependent methyltransferase